MKINEKESILYSIDPKNYKLVFDEADSAGTLIGVCCHVDESDKAPKFFAVSNNEAHLDLSSMLKENGGYDLTVIPIYQQESGHNTDDELKCHIHLGKCHLVLKKAGNAGNGRIKYKFECKEDSDVRIENLEISYSYYQGYTPTQYDEYNAEKGTNSIDPALKKDGWNCWIKCSAKYEKVFENKAIFDF